MTEIRVLRFVFVTYVRTTRWRLYITGFCRVGPVVIFMSNLLFVKQELSSVYFPFTLTAYDV
jgi:hypothetical protein